MPRVLTVKKQPRPGLCRMVDNGEPCPRPAKTRGLCSVHYSLLRNRQELHRFALPHKQRRYQLVRKTPEEQEEGICTVISNGVPCRKPGVQRGLCRRHYVAIWQRPDLDLDAFAMDAAPRLKLRGKLVDGECRISENGKPCRQQPHARGLCKRHYSHIRAQTPALFESLAAPDRFAIRYTRREHLVPGRCRVAEDGVGCGQSAAIRGLCRHHYAVLRRQPAVLAEVALAPRGKRTLERGTAVPGGCLVIENGEACTQPAWKRGICRRHHAAISNAREYSLDDFYLPEEDPRRHWRLKEDQRDGRCRIEDEEGPCLRDALTRGLCRRHYRRAQKLGILEQFALPPRRMVASALRAQVVRSRIWLDKNVLFDHSNAVVFGQQVRQASVDLVELVQQGRILASLSADGLKTVYNHVRYRLGRPVEERGRGLDDHAADLGARSYLNDTFFGPAQAAWRLEMLDVLTYRSVAEAPPADLSLEDAWEWSCYLGARKAVGSEMPFITWDSDFPAGVTPAAYLEAWTAAEDAT